MKLSHKIACAALAICAAALAVAPPASAQTAKPAARAELDLQEARSLVLELPEVKAWQDARREENKARTDGKSSGGVLTGLRNLKGVKHWAVTFYKDPQTAPKKWAVFLVRAKDGRIFAEKEDGGVQTLDEWRKAQPAS
jgi:hypothetical protein